MALLESRRVHRRDKIKNVEFEERVIRVSRVTKVVTGGRIFSFSSLVVIGNKTGHVGLGLGKSLEVSSAKKKAINDAKNNLYSIVITKAGTVPHEVSAKFGASSVIIRPAGKGTGIIAGGGMRLIFECLGIKDVVAKCFGSRNPHNVTKATLAALLKLKSHKYFLDFKGPDLQSSDVTEDMSDVSDSEDENQV